MANIETLKKSLCTGCRLCANVCPADAIVFEENPEGFIVPRVTEKCIDCGLCAKKCPKLAGDSERNKALSSYAVMGDDTARPLGSSGGVFGVLAEDCIAQGGIVAATAYTDGCRSLQYVIADSKEALVPLYKSKYFQSDAKDIYRRVAEKVKAGVPVLFCGCPCQVDAMKRYLGKSYENLLLVDILCHGVPSPKAYRKFLDEKTPAGKTVGSVDFRCKKNGWGTLIRIGFTDGSEVFDASNGIYMSAFLSGTNMRAGCLECSYSREERVGDITLGDFWGVHEINKSYSDGRGTSLVLANTEKGEAVLQKLKDKFPLFERIPYTETLEICKKTNGALVKPSYANAEKRKVFFENLDRFGFEGAYTRACKPELLHTEKNVGILGWWIDTSASNYGSILTDYALGEYVASLGYVPFYVTIPGFDTVHCGEFNKRYGYRMTPSYSYEDMKKNNEAIDTFIVGSDVLWYNGSFRQHGFTFMLDFADDSKKKISSATSFGILHPFFKKEEIAKPTELMRRFDAVSVREYEGVSVCKSAFGVDAVQVLDPIFYCGQPSWEKLEKNAGRRTDGDFIFAYFLDPTEEKARDFAKLAKKLHCKPVSITDKQFDREKKEEILRDCGNIPEASHEELIYHIKNSRFVVTDSFHGFCLSLIFRKQFYAIVNFKRGSARFETLSTMLNLSSHLVASTSEITKKSKKELLGLDYGVIEPRLENEVNRGRKWLEFALLAEKSAPDYEKKQLEKEIERLTAEIEKLKSGKTTD